MSFFDFLIGAGFVLFCVIAFNMSIANINQSYPEAVSFTVIDHDASDNSIYTSDGDILFTNRYQWKRLELNKTYVCDERIVNHVSNCHEQVTQCPAEQATIPEAA